eukprot:scaffold207_cov409-Prasinococcus_capsulatus_cf.AAC.45
MEPVATPLRWCPVHYVFATLSILTKFSPAFTDIGRTDAHVYGSSDIEVRYLSRWSRIGSGDCGDDCSARYTNFTTLPPAINLIYVKLPKAASTTTCPY